MTQEVLFCLTTHRACPSLAVRKGLASILLVVIYHLGPLSSNELHRCCVIIHVAGDWESENPSSGPRGVSIIPKQKRSCPKPGVTSASSSPLKASLPQAHVPSATCATCSVPGHKATLWIEFRIPGGSEQGRAGLPGHGFLEKNFELCFEGSRKWLDLLCYFQEKAKQLGTIRAVIKQVAAEFFWRRDGK